MIAKSRPRWLVGDFKSRSTFSRKTGSGTLPLENPLDRPPEHALLPYDAMRLAPDFATE